MFHGFFWLPLPGCNHPFTRHSNHPISTCQAGPVPFHSIILLQEKEGDRVKVIPFLKEALCESLYHCHSLLPPPTPIETWTHRLRRHFTSTQLQVVTQAKAQLEWKLLLKLEELAKNHENQWARNTEQVDTTLREILSQMSQADWVRLLPWFLCATAHPGTGPLHYVSEALTTVMQPKADAPVDDTTLEFKGSLCFSIHEQSSALS